MLANFLAISSSRWRTTCRVILIKGQIHVKWHRLTGPNVEHYSKIPLTRFVHIIFMTRSNLSKIDTFFLGSVRPLVTNRSTSFLYLGWWINYLKWVRGFAIVLFIVKRAVKWIDTFRNTIETQFQSIKWSIIPQCWNP